MEKQSLRGDLPYFLRQWWRLLKPYKRYIYVLAIWIVIMQALAIVEPYGIMYVVDGIVGRNVWVKDHLWLIMLVMFAVLGSIGAVQVGKNRTVIKLLTLVEHELPVLCGQKLLRLPLVYHQTENTGMVIGKVVRGVGKTLELMSVIFFEILPLAVQTIITAVILTRLNALSAIIILPAVATFGYATVRIKRKWADHRIRRHELDGEADELLGQAVTNVMTTQAFVQEQREMAEINDARKRYHDMCNTEFGHYYRNDVFRNALVSLGRVLVIFACARAAFGGTLTMGALVFVCTLAEKVFISCYRIGTVYDRMMEAMDPVLRMVRIFDEPETVLDPAAPLAVPDRLRGAIELKKVSYRYRQRTSSDGLARKQALKDVCLRIEPGEAIGLVGESGCGKSTLVKLLMRFDDPTDGAVCLDDLDIRELSAGDFRRQIGYVPQEVEIYDRTVAENIAYGAPRATMAEIERAARIASAHDFISELENGYAEMVGNRGLRLSGGQRQRIGIARAVLLNPPILIFDEATSHVDVVSERKIQAAIEELRFGRTVILIAHRLSTIQNADRIVVMDEGQIKEIGSHRELLGRKGLYQRLVDIQTKAEAVA
jgi:ATP-binding cassette subfamily B protein